MTFRIAASFLAVVCGLVAIVVGAAIPLRPKLAELVEVNEDHAQAVAIVSAINGEMASLRSAVVRSAIERRLAIPRESLARYEHLERAAGELDRFADTGVEREATRRLLELIQECAQQANRIESTFGDDDALRGALSAFMLANDALDATAQRIVEFNASQVRSGVMDVHRSLERTALWSALVAVMGITGALALLRYALVGFRRYSLLLEARAEEMSAFAGRAAHEVRGPLQTAILAVAAAREAPERDRHLVRAERSLRLVSRIVHRLLEFARAGGTPASGARSDVRHAIDQALAELESRIDETRMRVETDVDPGLCVAMDPVHLHTIVSNLVTNALKYGQEGRGGRITIAGHGRQGIARIDVADEGPGIAPNALPRVFEPLYQANPRADGIGLGLATVRRLVVAHGGSVEIESVVGKGTVASVQLPLARSMLPPSAAAAGREGRTRSGSGAATSP